MTFFQYYRSSVAAIPRKLFWHRLRSARIPLRLRQIDPLQISQAYHSLIHSFICPTQRSIDRRTARQTERRTDRHRNSFFSVRQHICYSALYAIARPSVRPSVTRADQSKTVKVSITKPSPESSPMTLVSWCLTSPWKSKGKIGNGGVE